MPPAPPLTARYVPVLPESAPFTAEQRAYLNGFLAGLFSFSPVPGAQPSGTPAPSQALTPLTILFASQTGTAEKLAKRIAKTAGARGFAPTLHDLARYPREQLPSERHLLLVTSTYGDGEPPDSAKPFWQWLAADGAPQLPNTRFSVCALGDSNYPRFCAFGRQLDERLHHLGAQRALDRTECDADPEKPFALWLSAALHALAPTPAAGSPSPGPTVTSAGSDIEPLDLPTRDRPFAARLKTNRRLNTGSSSKDVRHFEISLEGAPTSLAYEVGDALGILPRNPPDLVEALVAALGALGDEAVPAPTEGSIPLREALLQHYEIARIPQPLLRHYATRTGDALLTRVAAPDANGELTRFLYGRDVLDLVAAHPSARPDPVAFVGFLRRLQPRLYSISSSPKATPGEVHLTVSAVRYEAHGRRRVGVASTFLADRCTPDQPLPVYVHSNPAFRPPASDRPLVMVGPGTGIAPFRAFLLERRAVGAKGRNWLFFGDQHVASDFLYRDEMESLVRDGVLHRLHLAWSRDQAEKIYVQHRLLEHAGELWAWLEDGASFCVCGDASRMAKDVDAALHRVVEIGGGRTPEQAAAYVRELQSAGRYVRDVY